MANATRNFLREIFKKTAKYRATWLPTKTLRIGDIGILEGDVFTHRGSLVQLGIQMQVRTDVNEAESWDLSSENGIEIKFKAEGQVDAGTPALGELDAGFHIDFKKENSFVFKMKGYKTYMIENLMMISEEVLELYAAGEWEKEWVIINELVEAQSATILLSSEGGVSVGVKASGNANVGNLDLADGGLELGSDTSGKLAVSIVGRPGVTPLYRAVGIKKKWFDLFGEAKFTARDLKAKGETEHPFEQIGIDK